MCNGIDGSVGGLIFFTMDGGGEEKVNTQLRAFESQTEGHAWDNWDNSTLSSGKYSSNPNFPLILDCSGHVSSRTFARISSKEPRHLPFSRRCIGRDGEKSHT